jgi:hypothetical protein
MSSRRFSPVKAFRAGLVAVLLPWLLSIAVYAQTSPPVDKTLELSPNEKWSDTGIDLKPGEVVNISASPTGSNNQPCDPQGWANAVAEKLPLASALPGALIAKLQDKTNDLQFVGAQRELKVTDAGRLYLASNLSGKAPCSGKYSVKIHVAPAGEAASIKSKLNNAAQIFLSGQFGATVPSGASAVGSAANPGSGPAANSAAPGAGATRALAVSNAPLDSGLTTNLQSVPRRVSDEFKNPGDMVNFILVGSEKQVQDALTAANWHAADTSKPTAVVNAILQTYQKQDYLSMPMSQLYLYGRIQDLAYEQAEPYAMVASRHHFRIWKTPFTYKDQTVWAGAGTHDIGFEKDQRNGKVTHKIDPAVDGERDHIGATLQQAGDVKQLSYFLPSDPVSVTKNATGGSYHSDGRVLVIFLR